jgi:hypothetical protein
MNEQDSRAVVAIGQLGSQLAGPGMVTSRARLFGAQTEIYKLFREITDNVPAHCDLKRTDVNLT